jgi:hypothetical protein
MSQLGPAAAEQMKPSPLYQQYAQVAPRPEYWTRLVTKVAKLVNTDYDWSKDVAGIKAPTMLVFGDADSVQPEHIVGRREEGWRLGRVGNFEGTAGGFARGDALQHCRVTRVGSDGYAVSGCADAGGNEVSPSACRFGGGTLVLMNGN